MDRYDELGAKLLASSLKPGGIFAGLIDDMLGFNKQQSGAADSQPEIADNDQLVVPPLDG